MSEDLPRMTLREHLDELRSRVLRSVLALVGAMVLAWIWWNDIWDFAKRPFQAAARRQGLDIHLQTIVPGEGFMQIMKITFLAALVSAAPIVLWQMWGFVSAGLYAHERRFVRIFFPVSVLLFALGVVAAYLLLIPFALSFLMGFDVQMDAVQTAYRVESYLSLCITMVIAMGLAFQLPLVILFLEATNIVQRATFRKGWRIAVVLAFALSMVITPDPSPVGQTVMALPLIGLYFVGVWGGRFVGENREPFSIWKAWPLALGLALFVWLLLSADRLNDWAARMFGA